MWEGGEGQYFLNLGRPVLQPFWSPRGKTMAGK